MPWRNVRCVPGAAGGHGKFLVNEPFRMTLRQTPLDDVGRAGSAMNAAADDHQLVGRIAAGDQTALRALYGRHQGRVFRFILRLVRRDAIAEELTNEVFLEVWRNAGTFEGKASASTWLLSIAHHRAVSTLRKRREEAWNEETAAEIADTDDDPEVVAQKADKGALLRRAMRAALARAPRDRRPRLLSRDVDCGGQRGGGHPGEHRQDAHVLRTQAAFRNSQDRRRGQRLAMSDDTTAAAEREEIEMLLPWYVSGRLDADDRARVETPSRPRRKPAPAARPDSRRAAGSDCGQRGIADAIRGRPRPPDGVAAASAGRAWPSALG